MKNNKKIKVIKNGHLNQWTVVDQSNEQGQRTIYGVSFIQRHVAELSGWNLPLELSKSVERAKQQEDSQSDQQEIRTIWGVRQSCSIKSMNPSSCYPRSSILTHYFYTDNCCMFHPSSHTNCRHARNELHTNSCYQKSVLTQMQKNVLIGGGQKIFFNFKPRILYIVKHALAVYTLALSLLPTTRFDINYFVISQILRDLDINLYTYVKLIVTVVHAVLVMSGARLRNPLLNP